MIMQYHFCNFKTFKNILRSRELWLTDLTSSNDSEEVLRLYEHIWQGVKAQLLSSDLEDELVESQIQMLNPAFNIQKSLDIPYGCCFCSEDDLVNQWIRYADNGTGVALGFDFEWFHENGVTWKKPITSSVTQNAIGFDKVLYDSDRLTDDFYNVCLDALENYGNKAWIFVILPTFKHYAAFIKNPTFVDERETRIVYYPDKDMEDSIPVLGDKVEEPVSHYPLKWITSSSMALKTITVGKACKLGDDEILKMIKDMCLPAEEIEIKHSECSYRF